MEMPPEDLLNVVREKCSSHWGLEVYKDHIIINLPDMEEDFRSAYLEVKREITACVKQHFPERNTEILFKVRNGSWNSSFKLGKTVA
jgi:hypothetical protein